MACSRHSRVLPTHATPTEHHRAIGGTFMLVHRSGSARGRRFAATGILLAALSLLLAQPSSAADVPSRGSAHMGMGVLAHDGQQGTPVPGDATQTEGVDVSGHQGNVAWSTLWNSGVK